MKFAYNTNCVISKTMETANNEHDNRKIVPTGKLGTFSEFAIPSSQLYIGRNIKIRK